MTEEMNKNLKNTKIILEEKKIKIELLNEGWITETFLILNNLKNCKSCEIKDIFQVYKEDKMIVKEILEEKEILMKANYKEFLSIVKNETKKDNMGSGKINWNRIKEIEIRLNKKIKDERISGFNENMKKIIFEEIFEINIS